MKEKQENKNKMNTKFNYIKINHKSKIEELVEIEYYNELMNLANTLQSGLQNIGPEINKFFQCILPESKESDLLKINIAISNKSKKDKKHAYECLNNIMNMKESNNLILSKDFSEKLSTILKEIYRKIKKKSTLKTYNDLITKAKECLYQSGNIIKKYTVEKTINTKVYNNDDNYIVSKTLNINDDNDNDNDNDTEPKEFNNSNKNLSNLSKSFKEKKILEFQFKEFKEDKKEILPAEMRLLIKKFSIVKKLKLTLSDDKNKKNKKNKLFELNSNDIQNNILVLFNINWLFQNLLELEVDLSNEYLLKEQIDIQSMNLEILSDLLNKEPKLSIYHSGIYKNKIYNPYQLSNFYSSSVQIKEEDYLYIQQNINSKNTLTYFSNFEKNMDNKNDDAFYQFMKNKKNIIEMIIIYGYFISKMESIHMCDFVLPMNLEQEILSALKMNKIILNDFHFLSFFTNEIFHFTINFNSLDSQSFEKILSFMNHNNSLKICRINFFQSEEYFKPELLYKLLQNSDKKYKNLNDFTYNDSNYYIYDLRINEDLEDYLLRKLSAKFRRNLANFFYLLTLRTNISELSLLFDIPTIISKNEYYIIVILKFLLNLFIFMDSSLNNLDTLSVQAENIIFDSRRIPTLYNFFDKLSFFNNPKHRVTKLTYQVTFYKIINIYRLVPYNIENLSLGAFDLETFKAFVEYITSCDFNAHSSLNKLQINLNNSIINYDECKEYLIRLLTEYPKSLKEINIYTYLILNYNQLKKLLLETNYNTLENIFLQISKKSLKDPEYKNILKKKINKNNNIITERDFLKLSYIIRKKKDTNKIINIMSRLSLKFNHNFFDYPIFLNIEKFISNNAKKMNIVQFK